jgi:hypothetical protein
MQLDKNAVLTADLASIAVGRFESPVLGSGVFVGGTGNGGHLDVQRLEARAIYVDGRIPPGTPDQITGGVFVVSGAYVYKVTNRGPVVTYGGQRHGPRQLGCGRQVGRDGKGNYLAGQRYWLRQLRYYWQPSCRGTNRNLQQGARGFNVYNGTVDQADFDRIVTHADGAVGVQISQPIGTMVVRRGIETFGGTGPSLVKGVVQNLPATALSIKPGGSAELIKIEGGLRSHGKDIFPLEQQGTVQTLVVDGGFGHLSNPS